MTQEDKELLLVDLCSRLPYKVKCSYERILPEGYLLSDAQTIGTMDSITIPFVEEVTVKIDGLLRGLSDFKMYLRPLSSMTEEELKELKNYTGLLYDNLDLASFQNGTYKCLDFYLSEVPADVVIKVFDWLNQHHFDYRGLIEQGLALEAPKDIYKER